MTMTDPHNPPQTEDELRRENAYLKRRCIQLEGDVVDVEAQVVRLAQQLERLTAKREAHRSPPNPLGGAR